MRSKRPRDPSQDPDGILARWRRIGSYVILLTDKIRQVQRRVILLRLRRKALGGTLDQFIQAFNQCAKTAPQALLPRVF